MRRARSDSKLKSQLKPDQREELGEWLRGGIAYRDIRAKIKEKFKMTTTLSAISDFWQDYVANDVIIRRRRAVSVADDLAEEIKRDPGKLDEATTAVILQKAFEMSLAQNVDANDVKQMFSLVLKSQKQDIERQKLQLQVKQYKASMKRLDKGLDKEVSSGGLTVEQRDKLKKAAGLIT